MSVQDPIAPTSSRAPALTRPESLLRRVDRADAARTLFVLACTIALALGPDWPGPGCRSSPRSASSSAAGRSSSRPSRIFGGVG